MTARPYNLVAELTYRCPLRCAYCSNPVGYRNIRDALDADAWSRVFREAAALGIVHVGLTGGEPSTRSDLAEIISGASDAGLYTHLITAGSAAESLAEWVKAGLRSVQLSIQDSRPEANDRIAGVECFDRKLSFAHAVREQQLPLCLNFVLHRHNLDRLEEILALGRELGAHRIGEAGEGDDGAGTMEEDFLAWKDPMWAALASKMGLEEREAVYEPTFGIVDRETLTRDSVEVYLGEPNKMHLEGTSKGPFNAHNPYIAPIAESRELFSAKDRNCIHLDIDVSASNLNYQTGDHIAVWPTNPGDEVDRFLDVIGLTEKRNDVISVKALEPTAKVPFPTPTTYDAIVRYHLEVCAPVSRQFVATLAAFSPSDDIKAEMTRLGNDKDYFHDKTGPHFYNIARLLATVGKGQKWTNIPFSAFIEGLNKLQPRYYSISSSSLVQPKKISITAVVESQMIPGRNEPFRGVATNYLFALKQKQNGDPNPQPFGQSYELNGPRNKYDGVHVPVHVRHSNFKLPSDPGKPVIMIGPGTGVAPFRGFVQERAKQAREGANVGRTLLFFGCRKSTEDFMYESEWAVSHHITCIAWEQVSNALRRSTRRTSATSLKW